MTAALAPVFSSGNCNSTRALQTSEKHEEDDK